MVEDMGDFSDTVRSIGPPPAGCHYRNCWCMLWIVPNSYTRKDTCSVCGVDKRRSSAKEFAWVGMNLIEKEAEAGNESQRPDTKNKSEKQSPDVRDRGTSGLDVWDDRERPSFWGNGST